MKKLSIFLVSLAAVILLSGGQAFAQGRFGVIGGMTFSNAEQQSLNRSTMNKYHVGVTFQLKLPLGFSIQPALQYHVKGSKLQGDATGAGKLDLSVGFLEVPVSLQWGPDLLLFRPFVDVTPFIGYALNSKMETVGIDADMSGFLKNSYVNRFEYGLGLGVGLEIWKFQVIGRYNWNFGSIYNTKAKIDGDANLHEIIRSSFNENNFSGITLSVAFLF